MVTFKQARINAGLSQRAAAAKAKVSRSSIQRIENNGISDHTFVITYCKMLHGYNLSPYNCLDLQIAIARVEAYATTRGKNMTKVKIEYIKGKNKGKITITAPMTQPEADHFIDNLKGDDSTNTEISIINDDIEVHYQDYLSLKHRKSAK